MPLLCTRTACFNKVNHINIVECFLADGTIHYRYIKVLLYLVAFFLLLIEDSRSRRIKIMKIWWKDAARTKRRERFLSSPPPSERRIRVCGQAMSWGGRVRCIYRKFSACTASTSYFPSIPAFLQPAPTSGPSSGKGD